MRNTCLLTLFIISLLFSSACTTVNEAALKGRDPTLANLDSLIFTAESVTGQVQIRDNRNAPWRDLKAGDTFNGFAMIRSGFRSCADLSVKIGANTVGCELCDLICQTSVRDIYINVLAPASLAKYNEKMWEKGERIKPDARIQISRVSLNGEGEDKFSLLAEASDMVYPKSQQRTTQGAAGAAGGGAPGGGGSGGGGCPGGG
jgi:hypothetical protein